MTSQTQANRRKIQISYVIRDENERCHRSGINSLQYDPDLERLYSAGRDSIIRIWNVDPSATDGDPYIQSMEHHTDWVNDIILCCNGKTLISASNDTTVKVWNAHKGYCMSTLRTHKDYVKALAYAREKEQVASAGLDKSIFLWDVNTLTALTSSNNTVTTSALPGSKDSIYSLAMNYAGTVVVSGSAEKVLRVWDPRTCAKQMKLKGHTDNIRAIVLNKEGTQCISASSDGTMRLWSLGQQQCIQTYRLHGDSVWSLAVDEGFTRVYSACRRGHIRATELSYSADIRSCMIAEEKTNLHTNSVLKLCLDEVNNELWASTTTSNINKWSVKDLKFDSIDAGQGDSYIHSPQPLYSIPGATCIKQYHILNDRRHIITKDSQESIVIYDVLTARPVKDLGKVNFEQVIKERTKTLFVPSWFTVDLKVGLPTIHLDEGDCFAAWRSATEAEFETVGDRKVNYGCLLLQALLKHWIKTHQPAAEDENVYKNTYFDIPEHIPIILSDNNKTLLRLLVRDAAGNTENMLLSEFAPPWITDVVCGNKLPAFNKLPFFLQPLQISTKTPPRRERLSASDMLQVRKVIEHVYEKVLGQDDSSSHSHESKVEMDADELAAASLDHVEVYCNDTLLEPHMDLRTVKNFIWKQGADLTLCYRQKSPS